MTKIYIVSGNRGHYRDGRYYEDEQEAYNRSVELVAKGLCSSAGYGEVLLSDVPKNRRIRKKSEL